MLTLRRRVALKVYRDGKYSSPKCVIVNGRRERDPDITPGPADYAPCRSDIVSRSRRQPAYIMARADSAKRRQAQMTVTPGEVLFPLSRNSTTTTLVVRQQLVQLRVVAVAGKFKLQRTPAIKTSSSAVAKRPRDASCLSVVSFNSTKRRAQSFIVSYRLRYMTMGETVDGRRTDRHITVPLQCL